MDSRLLEKYGGKVVCVMPYPTISMRLMWKAALNKDPLPADWITSMVASRPKTIVTNNFREDMAVCEASEKGIFTILGSERGDGNAQTRWKIAYPIARQTDLTTL